MWGIIVLTDGVRKTAPKKNCPPAKPWPNFRARTLTGSCIIKKMISKQM